MATLKTKIQVRRDTAANLANIVLASGEPGYATDTKKYAVGDGSTKFSSLATQIAGSDSVDGFHITSYGYKYQSSASISLKRDQLADNTDYIYVKMTTTNNYHSQHVRFKVVPGYDNISGSTEVVAYCRAQNEFYLDSVLYNGNKFIGIYQPSANTNIYYLKFDKFNGTYASNTNTGSIVVYAQVPGITLSLIEKGHADYATVSAYSYVSVPSKGIYASHLWNNMYPTANNTNDLGSSSYKWKNIHGVTIYENGTSLASKYLGISAKAADSDKLDGKDSSEFATSGHTHTTTIATSTGTNELTLSHGGKYAITAGGDSFIFTMPSDNNTDTKVTQSSTTTDSWRKVVLGKQSGTMGTAVESQTDQVYVTPNIEVQPSTGTLAVKKLLITDTTMINHIEFKRNGWNYIVASGGTDGVFGFVAGGKSASGANATLAIYGSKFIPGQNDNKIDIGDSSYHFKDFYIKGKIYNGSYNYTLPSKTGTIALTSDITNTWREIKVNGTSILGTATNTGALNLKAGTAITITATAGSSDVTITSSDTKNTAGSTNSDSKLFLIGATSQAANPQTYSDSEVYTTNGTLTTNKVQVGNGTATMQYDSTAQCIRFVIA